VTATGVFQGNPFQLINAGNNFQDFDAQFGGSVPANPGAAQLGSTIFSTASQAQPGVQRAQPFTAFSGAQQQPRSLSVFGGR